MPDTSCRQLPATSKPARNRCTYGPSRRRLSLSTANIHPTTPKCRSHTWAGKAHYIVRDQLKSLSQQRRVSSAVCVRQFNSCWCIAQRQHSSCMPHPPSCIFHLRSTVLVELPEAEDMGREASTCVFVASKSRYKYYTWRGLRDREIFKHSVLCPLREQYSKEPETWS